MNAAMPDDDAEFPPPPAGNCRAGGVVYARVFDQLSADPVWLRQVAEGDGAHPGAHSYQRLADLVWTWWLPWITAAMP